MVDGELWLWCNFTVWVLTCVLSCLMTHGGSPGNMAGQQHGAVSPTIGRLVGWWVGGLVEIFTSLDVWLQTIEDRSECILKTSLCYCAKNKKVSLSLCSQSSFLRPLWLSLFSQSSQIRPSAWRVKPIWNSAESRVLSPFTNPRTQKYDMFGTNTCSTAEFEAFLGDLCKKKNERCEISAHETTCVFLSTLILSGQARTEAMSEELLGE